MADITKCSGTNCPLKNDCFRFLAPESYSRTKYIDVPYKNGACEYFIKLFKK